MALHRQYGHVVRIGPNELSYDIPEAWDQVYGKPKARRENPKPRWYLSPERKEIVGADEKDHVRMRKLLGSGFTNAAILQMEPLITTNVDLLVQRLYDQAVNGLHKTIKIDMFEWLSYCTFDIIGDMTFGESFGCLQEGVLHPWLAWAFDDVKLAHTLVLSLRFPFFAIFLPVLETWNLWRNSKIFENVIRTYIDKRLERGSERSDFVELMNTRKGPSVSRICTFLPKFICKLIHRIRN